MKSDDESPVAKTPELTDKEKFLAGWTFKLDFREFRYVSSPIGTYVEMTNDEGEFEHFVLVTKALEDSFFWFKTVFQTHCQGSLSFNTVRFYQEGGKKNA